MRETQQAEPLSPEMAELLALERKRPAPPEDMQRRVLLGVMTAVSLPPLPSEPGAPSGAPAGAASKVASATGSKAVLAKIFVGFAVGAISGAGVHAYLSPASRTAPASLEKPAVVAHEPPIPEPAAPQPVMPAADPMPPPKVAKAKAPRARDHQSVTDSDLARERAILEQARLALVRGRYGDAVAALNQHKKQYPTGRLVEEREALSILVFVGLGDTEKAQQRLAQFERAYPNSMLLPSVEKRVGAVRRQGTAPPRSPGGASN